MDGKCHKQQRPQLRQQSKIKSKPFRESELTPTLLKNILAATLGRSTHRGVRARKKRSSSQVDSDRSQRKHPPTDPRQKLEREWRREEERERERVRGGERERKERRRAREET